MDRDRGGIKNQVAIGPNRYVERSGTYRARVDDKVSSCCQQKDDAQWKSFHCRRCIGERVMLHREIAASGPVASMKQKLNGCYFCQKPLCEFRASAQLRCNINLDVASWLRVEQEFSPQDARSYSLRGESCGPGAGHRVFF